MTDGLAERLQDCVATAAPHVQHAAQAIDTSSIAFWADALRDPNPVYTDAAAARATGRPGVVAPPTMVQAWTMPGIPQVAATMPRVPGYLPWQVDGASPPDRERNSAGRAMAMLSDAGFTSHAATNSRQTYHRDAVPGDVLTCTTVLSAVSPEKNTVLGAGHFVTTTMTYRDHEGRTVAVQEWTVFCFRPAGAAAAGPAGEAAPGAPAPAGPAPAPDAKPTRRVCSAPPSRPAVGDTLPPTVVPITHTFVTATAFATRDYYPMHHDTDWARSLGRRDIFTNILSTTGLVGGVATDWGGPATRLRSVDLRLLTPNHPGDTLTLAATVTAVEPAPDGGEFDEITLQVVGTNAAGPHVVGTVVAAVASTGGRAAATN